MNYPATLRTTFHLLALSLALLTWPEKSEAQQPTHSKMNAGIIFLTTCEGDVKFFTPSSEQAQALQGCHSETRSARSHWGEFQSLAGI